LTVTFRGLPDDPETKSIAQNAMSPIGIMDGKCGLPMRSSEDFGVFGSGANHASLHNPDYKFPYALIPIGCR